MTPIPQTVAFLGLGNMGGPMAGRLLMAEKNVRVFNRGQPNLHRFLETAQKLPSFTSHGYVAKTPMDAVQGANYVCLCLSRDEDVEQMVQTIKPYLSKGAIVIDHTTASATLAKHMEQVLQEVGCFFVDAPVSGGIQGAQKGTLAIMVGAPSGALFQQAANDILCHLGNPQHMGEVGSGQLTKMMNQILLAPIMASMAEAFCFAKCANLDVEKAAELVKGGAANSWQLQHRTQSMLNQDIRTLPADQVPNGFSLALMRKDLHICLAQAEKMGMQLPLIEAVVQMLERLCQKGHANKSVEMLLEDYQQEETHHGCV